LGTPVGSAVHLQLVAGGEAREAVLGALEDLVADVRMR